MWLLLWMTAVPANLTVVLVLAFNVETRLVRTEVRNGMVSPGGYLLARAVLEVPLVVFFCVVALGVPGFAVGNFHAADGRVFTTSMIWMAQAFSWDSYASACSVMVRVGQG